MDAPLPDAHCHLSRSGVHRGISPSGGYGGNDKHSHLHSDPLGRSLPLFLYPARVEQGVYDGSYRSGATLLSYLPPFHAGLGVYECPFEPAFIQKRNERERQRVKCVNQGYAKLRDHLPDASADKRLSKVETLRAAIRYIKYLQSLVEKPERREENVEATSPLSFSDTSSEESAGS